MSAGHIKSASNPFALQGNCVDTNLLSPPLSVSSLDISPFKPADSDHTSLCMKYRRRRRRSRRHPNGVDRASTGDTEEQSIHPQRSRKRLTSTSVPDLRRNLSSQKALSAAGQFLMRQQLEALHVAHRKDSVARSVESKRRASLPRKPRRWTMPSKAASTRVLSECPTPMITTSIVARKSEQEHARIARGKPSTSGQSLLPSPQAENNSLSANSGETPAMITLRRASKKGTSSLVRRTSLRPNAITSFPPPKFNRTASTYLASFFGTNALRNSSKNEDHLQTSVRQSSWSTGPNSTASLRKASVTADRVQLSANTIAAPAVTQVEFLPFSRSRADQQEFWTHSARRCSTTIVSGSSVHEIIWDENTTSSGEGSTGAGLSRQTSTSPKKSRSRDYGRRESVLVQKLEAQLRRNEQRRASLGSQSSNSSRRSSEREYLGKATFGKLTGWNLGSRTQANDQPEYDPDIGLKPELSHDICTTTNGLFATFQEGGLSPTAEHVDFFPPLGGLAGNSQKSSGPREQSPGAETRRQSIEDQASNFTLDVSASSDRVFKGKDRARQSSPRFPDPRRPSRYHPYTAMGTGIGQSSHVRRRSSEAHQPTFATWSRRVSRQRTSEHSKDDETTPLLPAHDDSTSDFAAASLFVDGHNALAQQAGETMGGRRMSVQDFVQQIEGMSRAQCPRSVGLDPEEPGRVGLVRRDSPWVVRRRVSKGGADVDKDKIQGLGKGKMLSEVGEEGRLASASGSALGEGEGSGFSSIRMMSGEGSEVFV